MKLKAEKLCAFVRAQLGMPYYWGGCGETASAAWYEAKKAQYPAVYAAYGDCSKDYGKRVFDCVGLVKAALWFDAALGRTVYGRTPDVNAAGMYHACEKRGRSDTRPDKPGILLFTESLGHVGVYVGGGRVIEAKGHAYGVVETALNATAWALWGECPWVSYEEETKEESAAPERFCVELAPLSEGAAGERVRALQYALLGRGISCGVCGADGEFGPCTKAAVRVFQESAALPATGSLDERSFRELWGVSA